MGRIVVEEARGLDGLKEAKLTIKPGEKSPFKMFEGKDGEGITLNIAVANGLGNAKKLIKVSVWAWCCHRSVVKGMVGTADLRNSAGAVDRPWSCVGLFLPQQSAAVHATTAVLSSG